MSFSTSHTTSKPNALHFYPNGIADSNATLVGHYPAPSESRAPARRTVDYDAAFGNLATVYGFGGALAGPPPVNPSGSRSSASRKAKTVPLPSTASAGDAAFGNVATVYGASGAFPAPVDAFPGKKYGSTHAHAAPQPPLSGTSGSSGKSTGKFGCGPPFTRT